MLNLISNYVNYRFDITEEDVQLAKSAMWKEENNIFIGNLAEILAAKYLNTKPAFEEKKNRNQADCGYDLYTNGLKYQVKSLQDSPNKKKIFLEKKNLNFDRYILVIISQDVKWGEVLVDADRLTIENNSHFDDRYQRKYIQFRQ